MTLEVVQTDVSDVSKAIAIIGAFVVFVGPISLVIKERLYLSEPLLAVTFGCVSAPAMRAHGADSAPALSSAPLSSDGSTHFRGAPKRRSAT